ECQGAWHREVRGRGPEPLPGLGTWLLWRANRMSGCLAPRGSGARARAAARLGDMAVVEGEQNVRVPGTERFGGVGPGGRPAGGHGCCGGRTECQGAWHREVRGRRPGRPPGWG